MASLALLSFCVLTRRIEEKGKERKGGLVGGREAEAHIWVIGVDRPWIIPPDNRTSETWRGGGGVGWPEPYGVYNEGQYSGRLLTFRAQNPVGGSEKHVLFLKKSAKIHRLS